MDPIQQVLVLGGGSAGFLAAITLKTKLPKLEVVVLRSPELGIIGVGEGTVTYVPEHLHGYLQIPLADFFAQAQPSWKLGVRFLWGPRPSFFYPFTSVLTRHEPGLPKAVGFYCTAETLFSDRTSALMHAGKGFARLANNLPLIERNVAYHLENETFVTFLEQHARRLGIVVAEGTVTRVEQNAAGIERLHCSDGRQFTADLFVDCSGFHSQLLGKALGEPFDSFRSSLFCDRAVVGGWARTSEPILPYTTAETMNAGWCWQIEHEHRINRGYVYSSDFIDDGEAETEFRAQNPLVEKTRVVKFVTGVHRRTWVKNVVAIGNAAGFVEPLEATALYVICASAQALAACLYSCACQPEELLQRQFNNYGQRIWSAIRRFLAVHYRFNTRLDTPFWQAARADVDLVDATPLVEYYQEYGPDPLWAETMIDPIDPFKLDGYCVLLQGQQVPCRRRYAPSQGEQVRWNQLYDEWTNLAANGVDIREALSLIRHPHWQWHPDFYRR